MTTGCARGGCDRPADWMITLIPPRAAPGVGAGRARVCNDHADELLPRLRITYPDGSPAVTVDLIGQEALR